MRSRETPSRLLIVLLGAIGDVTRALPLACRLRRAYAAGVEIHWAVEPASAPLVEGHPALSGTVVFDRRRGPAAFPRFMRDVRALRADCTLDLQRHVKSGWVALYSGARRRIGFARANSREGNFAFQTERLPPMDHLSSKLHQFLRFADHLGVPAAPIEFGLAPRPQDLRAAERLLDGVRPPFAIVLVGSTAPSRLWFAAPTARVIDWLADRGVGAVLVGGRGEEATAAPIEAAARAPVRNLVGRTGLRDLTALFARARLAIGPDCGPMHMAAAAGVPVVSLWGATSAARSSPHGCEDLVVEGEAPCRPCFLKHCPVGRLCMERIPLANVLAAVERALERGSSVGR